MTESFGRALRRWRETAGMSQPQLARQVPISQSSLSRYECDRQEVDRHTAARLDELVGAGGALVATLPPVDKLRAGSGLVMPPADIVEPVTAVLDKPWRVDKGALNSVATILTATRRLEDQTSARAVLASVEGLTNIVDVYTRDARSAVGEKTLALASELHTYLGWLNLSSGHELHAGKHWDAAIALALEIDHPDLLAHAASFKGYEAMLAGNLDRAVNLSTLSLRDKRTFMALRVFDGYQLGHAYALQGEQHQAEQAMAAADHLLERVDRAPLPRWAYWYNPPFLLTQRAIAHKALSRKDHAIADLKAGLAEIPAEHQNAEWVQEIRERLERLERGE